MVVTWILVAHRSGARLFENKGPRKGLTLVQNIEHPVGRLKSQDIDSDKHGRSFDSRGQGRHAYGKEHEPTAHVAEQFAKQLATLLEEGRNKRRYTKLVLVAEPRFLGNLRAVLTPQTAALITGTLGKDLGSVEARDMPKHLGAVMRI
ncbi:MAG: host attachment protein [Gammaproteobacteria bacterium]|nr:MAG: host attachment protein [Gammaproteobacteria bacterium]